MDEARGIPEEQKCLEAVEMCTEMRRHIVVVLARAMCLSVHDHVHVCMYPRKGYVQHNASMHSRGSTAQKGIICNNNVIGVRRFHLTMIQTWDAGF